MPSPTQRSLKALREAGMTVAVTEHWNPFAHIRQDLFQVFDLVALCPVTRRIYGVQVSTTGNIAKRRKKILESQEARLWSRCGGGILLHGWSKKGPRGKRKTWTLTPAAVTWETPTQEDCRPLPGLPF